MEEQKKRLEELRQRREELENCDNEDEYNEMLNDCYPMVNVAGIEMYPALVLERTDPIAYRCGHSDFNDSLLSEIEDEIEELLEEIQQR